MSTHPHGNDAAGLFHVVWGVLVGVLGTAAAATLLRRAARAAARNRPDLSELEGFDIVREGLEYRVILPEAWSGCGEECLRALAHLVRDELCPLLVELTGPVVVRLLARRPELEPLGIGGEKGASE